MLGGPDRYFDPTAFVEPGTLVQPGYFGNLGRNTMIGPGLANVDVSLFKNTSLTERVNLQFRVEAFNFFNRANFRLPDNTLFRTSGARNPTAGRITTIATTGRQFQLGLKLLW